MLPLPTVSESVTVHVSPGRTAVSGMSILSSAHGTVVGSAGVPTIVAEPAGAKPLTVRATLNAIERSMVITEPVPEPPNALLSRAATASGELPLA